MQQNSLSRARCMAGLYAISMLRIASRYYPCPNVRACADRRACPIAMGTNPRACSSRLACPIAIGPNIINTDSGVFPIAMGTISIVTTIQKTDERWAYVDIQ
jgi:hypothetical protein